MQRLKDEMKTINWLYHWHWNILRAKYGDWSLICFFFFNWKRSFLFFLGLSSSKSPIHTHICACWWFSCVRLCATLLIVAYQAPLYMEFFSRQEYWSGLPCPPPGGLLHSGTELVSLMFPALAGGSFTTSATWEAHIYVCVCTYFLKAAFGSYSWHWREDQKLVK